MIVRRSLWGVLFIWGGCLGSLGSAQERQIPEALQPWQNWATWDAPHRDCPTPYDNSQRHLCFWPSRLNIAAGDTSGSWQIRLSVFGPSWIPLPGSSEHWPRNVRANETAVAVVQHEGRPAVKLQPGRYELQGEFLWDTMPQSLAIPAQVGLLSLSVSGSEVPLPTWDASGDLWLQRRAAEVADENLLAVRVYRLLEDGIPLWLRTEIELTVSGASREEPLGWVLPEGWLLSHVESPLPVAIDEQGRLKAQVRSGKWTIQVHAFRTTDVGQVAYAAEAEPIVSQEWVGFRTRPELRVAELDGLPSVDVSQTTYPQRWRDVPVYLWDTSSGFQVAEKLRGAGLDVPQGLSIDRQFWLDDDGRGLTFRDQLAGQMQRIWRLDMLEGQQLGAVRSEGQAQLITANPQNGLRGVEVRTRNLNLQAIGRADLGQPLAAAGWQADVDRLSVTLNLPPGWRVLAVRGPDHLEGDWLTAWTLLDLFLLLIFTLAVWRLWGWWAGLVALLAFGLSYHEPGAPRFTWLFVLAPLALLRVVGPGTAHGWITAWKYVATGLLVLFLIPFLAGQLQNALYPQLERPGWNYAPRGLLGRLGLGFQVYRSGARQVASPADQSGVPAGYYDGASEGQAVVDSSNLLYDPQAKIQMGPPEPEWRWNQVRCDWNGPVAASQTMEPILISRSVHRVLTVVRIGLLVVLSTIVFGVRRRGQALTGARLPAAGAVVMTLAVWPSHLSAQIPDTQLLETLRQRLLETSDAYPRAAELGDVHVQVEQGRLEMTVEVHAVVEVAVPLPGRLPAWSPVSVTLDQQTEAVVRRDDGYLWIVVPEGVHRVTVAGRLPDVPQWEWTYLLPPRRLTIEAPGWTVTGVGPQGVAEQQVFFVRQQPSSEREAAYDQTHFAAIAVVQRQLEIGLNWQVHSRVQRLSQTGQALAIRVPLLPGEKVLSGGTLVENGAVDVRLGAGETTMSWESELAMGSEIELVAVETDQWVQRWKLVSSPLWNVRYTGLEPVFEAQQQALVPVWRPWPGESVRLSISRPAAIAGDTVTVQRVRHETVLGIRERANRLQMDMESSLDGEFGVEVGTEVANAGLSIDGRSIPLRQDGTRLMVPLRVGKQKVELQWRTAERLGTVARSESIQLPAASANISSSIQLPEDRWVLWADGPLRGPAVRFWVIVSFALLVALLLGSVPWSPLKRWQWVLLVIGLTQVNIVAGLIVIGWFFLLAWRGRQDPALIARWRFNLWQVLLVLHTVVTLAILVVVVGEGLLGHPDMFIIGNQSTRTSLQWFEPRAMADLPQPLVISVSDWYYRLLMLFWALWLAASLLTWLQWAWTQFTAGGGWKRREVLAAELAQ